MKLADDGQMNWYGEGDIIKVDNLQFQILETPGHSPGSVSIICSPIKHTANNFDFESGISALFTGDTLFCGDCGRTDLEGGDITKMQKSLKRLYELDGDYELYPGHAESSMLDFERRHNPDMIKAVTSAI